MSTENFVFCVVSFLARYSVFKSLDREPIQGTEVQLGSRDGRVVVLFTGPQGNKRAKNLRKDLDEALIGWKALLDIRP